MLTFRVVFILLYHLKEGNTQQMESLTSQEKVNKMRIRDNESPTKDLK